MIYQVVFSPEARNQLVDLYGYFRTVTSQHVADKYIDNVFRYCAGLNIFPMRGTRRDELSVGLRITNYKKSCVIAFEVENETVTIIGIFYGGQDYESLLAADLDE